MKFFLISSLLILLMSSSAPGAISPVRLAKQRELARAAGGSTRRPPSYHIHVEPSPDSAPKDDNAERDDVLTATIAFVLPNQNLTNPSMRNHLRQFLADGLIPQIAGDGSAGSNVLHRLRVNPVYISGLSVQETVNQTFCSLAAKGVNALLIMTDKRLQGDDGTRTSNFLTTLAKTAGIPTLVWSTNAFELEQSEELDRNRILLAPQIQDQALAIFELLKAIPWQKFSILAVQSTPGRDNFVLEIRRLVDIERKNSPRFVDAHRQHTSSRLAYVSKLPAGAWRQALREELLFIRDSAKTNVILLYARADDANEIFGEARTLGMTAEEYFWIAAKTLLGDADINDPPAINIVPGTVVAYYDTSFKAQLSVLKGAVQIWSMAVRKLINHLLTEIRDHDEAENVAEALSANIAPFGFCNSSAAPQSWPLSNVFFELLKRTKLDLELDLDEDERFKTSSHIKLAVLDQKRNWRTFGEWTAADGLSANTTNELRIKHGQTDSTVLRIVTLEEAPYVVYGPTDHAGNCPRSALLCEIVSLAGDAFSASLSSNLSEVQDEPLARTMFNGTMMCCSGFCIDLLQRLAADIGFKFQLFEVPDGKWGVKDKVTGQWNGLVKAILDNEADIIMTSLKINKDRSEAIDFGIPFLETGITMVVAIRQGGISPMAFLEPFSPTAWLAILLGCVNAVVASMFVFEYVSVKGLLWGLPEVCKNQMKRKGKRKKSGSVHSFFSALWLVWAMLFKAAVRVQVPKCMGAKILTGVWGAFCVIFASSYMANLAVFMITKDDFYDFSGIEDYRLKNPFTKNPPYKFGTLSSGATEAFMRQNYPDMFEYMRQFNQSSASTGIDAVKSGQIDAFIYDATVLDFKASRDKECRLTTVGKWYAQTGYGIGFPKGSKWLPIFDKYIIDYQHNSFLQQLSDFWLNGACKRNRKQESNKSFQLGILNFTSAFVLLLLGLAFCFLILIIENVFSKYITKVLGASAVRLRIKQQLLKTHLIASKAPPSTKRFVFDMATISMNAIQCENCGGRGHWARKCPSPRMKLMGESESADKLQ